MLLYYTRARCCTNLPYLRGLRNRLFVVHCGYNPLGLCVEGFIQRAFPQYKTRILHTKCSYQEFRIQGSLPSNLRCRGDQSRQLAQLHAGLEKTHAEVIQMGYSGEDLQSNM